jgi:hypothetical protein
MERDIIDVVIEKKYIELTSVEKEEIASYISNEDEYNNLRDVMLGVQSIEFDQVSPKKETKDRLDDLFDQTYPKAAPVWYMSVLGVVAPKEKPLVRQPLVQIAAVVLLLLLAVPLFNTEIGSKGDEQLAVVTQESSKEDGTEKNAETSMTQPIEEDVTEESEVIVDEIIDEPVPVTTSPGSFSRAADLFSEPAAPMSLTFSSAGATATGFDHPDGVFDASVTASAEVSYSVSAGDKPDVLDLLTATF